MGIIIEVIALRFNDNYVVKKRVCLVGGLVLLLGFWWIEGVIGELSG